MESNHNNCCKVEYLFSHNDNLWNLEDSFLSHRQEGKYLCNNDGYLNIKWAITLVTTTATSMRASPDVKTNDCFYNQCKLMCIRI